LDKILTTGRAKITDEVRNELETLLKSYKTGIQINEVVMQPAQAPDAVKSAFDDVIKAREDREKMQNIAESYSNRVVPVAMGKAQRLRDEAGAYKQQVELQAIANVAKFNKLLPVYKEEPTIIKSQIYFDAMQSVLEKNKVFIVDGNGNNNLFYWPESAALSKDVKKSIGNAVSSSLNEPQVRQGQTEGPLKRTAMTKAQYLRWMEANK
jgi:membrane protease subunit HflK